MRGALFPKAARLALLAACVGGLPGPGGDVAAASERQPSAAEPAQHHAATQRQQAEAAAGRTRQLSLVMERLDTTRALRLDGHNANTGAVALRFAGEGPENKAVFDMRDHLAPEKVRRTQRLAVWFAGDVALDSTRAADGRASLVHSDGVAMGADARLSPRLIVGNTVGTGFDRVRIGEKGSLAARYLSQTVYGSFFTGADSYLDVTLGGALMDFSSALDAPGDGGRRAGHQLFGAARYSHDFTHDKTTIRPYGRLRLARSTLDGHGERGSAPGQAMHRTDETRIALGLGTQTAIERVPGTLRPRADVELAWTRKRERGGVIGDAADASPAAETARRSVSMTAGFDWAMDERTHLDAGYNISAAADSEDPARQSVNAGLRLRF